MNILPKLNLRTGPTSAPNLTRKLLIAIFSLLLGLAAARQSHAAFNYDPSLQWQTLQTEHFDIHFHDGEEAIAKRAAALCENQYQETGSIFNWYPAKRTQVVLVNTLDITNAGATPLPVNTMMLFMPASDNFSEDYDDWLRHLITHEYTHIVHLDKAKGAYKNLRDVFGRTIVFFPNLYQPTWVIEGLATYQETKSDYAIGRGQSSLYRSLMQIEWQQGLKSLRTVSMPIVSWPGGQTRYLYGVYFFNFLRDRYGKDSIARWIDQYSGNLLPWSVNSTSHKIFGHNLFSLWNEFDDYLGSQFQPIVDAVKAEGETKGEQLTQAGYYTNTLQRATDGGLYYLSNDRLSAPALYRLSATSASNERVMEDYGSSYDISEQGIVFNQREFQHNTNYFFEIYRANRDGSNRRQLTDGGRYSFVLWRGEHIIAVQQDGVAEKIVELDGDGNLLNTIWQGSPGVMISKPALSADGQSLLAAVWRPKNRWDIERLSLSDGHWQRLTQRRGDEGSPIFSRDGRHIYFVADYQHRIFNIYRMNLNGDGLQRVSNDMNGIVEVAELDNGDLAYVGLNGNGSDIYRLSPKQEFAAASDNREARDTPTHSPAISDLASSAYRIVPYSAGPRILPSAWYPYIFVDDTRAEYGFSTTMYDPLLRHQYSLFAAYDSDNNWFTGQLNYLYDRFNPAINLYIKRSIEVETDPNVYGNLWFANEQAAAELLFPLIKRDYQWRFDLGVVREKTSLLKTSYGSASASAGESIASMSVNFNSSKTFLRSINPASGHKLRLTRESFVDNQPDINKPAYILDWRYYYTLTGKTSLATRVLRAKSDSNDPFHLGGVASGFYLSSPSSVPADPTSELHKRNYALRGYPKGLAALTGSDLAMTEIECHFPISVIESGWMSPPLGINQISGNVFYSAANPQTGFNSDHVYRSLGIEFSVETVLGYFFPLPLDVGYARGLDDGGEDTVYLRLGGSF